jgi:solute carrier family 35 protein E3
MLPPTIIVASIATSAALILVTKQIITNSKFGFPLFLSFYHTFLTFLLLFFMRILKFFDVFTDLPFLRRWFIAFLAVLSLITSILTLNFNSIGFAELSKFLTIPCIALYNALCHSHAPSTTGVAAFLLLIGGLFFFALNDPELTLTGTLVAVGSAIATAIYHIEAAAISRQFALAPVQLSHALALPQLALSLIAFVAMESRPLIAHRFRLVEVILLLLTAPLAVVAAGVGFSVARADAFASQMLSHARAAAVLFFGMAMFRPPDEPTERTARKVVGIGLALAGAVAHSWADGEAGVGERPVKLAVEEALGPRVIPFPDAVAG